MAPNGLFLLPNVKNKLHGGFSSAEKAVDTIKDMFFACLKKKGKKCFDKRFERLQKCIDHKIRIF